ncbi:MAG: UDP-N-acetylmuramoylalanine--D-glutamate ligase [Moorella sp. (in: firmicutes)]|nr:UDP-N-acetylmuramoylalanine--D-glutamate ligase [Moorella sp. (in: firmicutes)]
MSWQGQSILVVGLGRSGRAAAVELARQGARVTACDRQLLEGEELAALSRAGVKLILGGYPEIGEWRPELVITSPGVPSGEPPLVEARKLGIPIWSELELAYRLLPAGVKVIAITGTNGKTTTTSLCGRILQEAGLPAVVGGNIGIPLVKELQDIKPGSYVVCEVSSFQLEAITSFHPRVAAILNITPDHLDRHGSLANYIAAKERVMAYQEAGDFVVLNYDDPVTRAMASRARGQVLFFSRQGRPPRGAWLEEGAIYYDLGPGNPARLCPREELSLKGNHNLENSMAASLVALALGVEPMRLRQTLKTFPAVPHRLEPVAEINGVHYINDSKGTNPEATMKALEAYPNPLVLIAGGRNKGSDFTLLAQQMVGRVKYLVLVGEAAPELEEAARKAGLTSIYRARDFAAAVREASRAAVPGDIVLLSPACASWDMFKNYEERGDIFKSLVRQMQDAGLNFCFRRTPHGG